MLNLCLWFHQRWVRKRGAAIKTKVEFHFFFYVLAKLNEKLSFGLWCYVC